MVPLRLRLRRLVHVPDDVLALTYYGSGEHNHTHPLLRRADGRRGAWCPPWHDMDHDWHDTAPYFYWDSRYTLFITPTIVRRVGGRMPWTWVESTPLSVDPQKLERAGYAADEAFVARSALHVLPRVTAELDSLRIDTRGVVATLGSAPL